MRKNILKNGEIVGFYEVDDSLAPVIRQITLLSFRKRFTLSEKVAIEESVDSTVKVISADLNAASFVDLDDTDTIAGIDYLTSVALLEAGRDVVILADGTESEAP